MKAIISAIFPSSGTILVEAMDDSEIYPRTVKRQIVGRLNTCT